MTDKNFNAITKNDIDSLIIHEVAESEKLEYKEKLVISTDKEKKEFLADISAFANTSGGDIIFGIKDALDQDGKKTGKPEKVVPLQETNANSTKLKVEEIIRNGIAPRVLVYIKEITGYGSNAKDFVLLVRIPKSTAFLHMRTYKSSSPFFRRNSAGKYPLDVHQICEASKSPEVVIPSEYFIPQFNDQSKESKELALTVASLIGKWDEENDADLQIIRRLADGF